MKKQKYVLMAVLECILTLGRTVEETSNTVQAATERYVQCTPCSSPVYLHVTSGMVRTDHGTVSTEVVEEHNGAEGNVAAKDVAVNTNITCSEDTMKYVMSQVSMHAQC